MQTSRNVIELTYGHLKATIRPFVNQWIIGAKTMKRDPKQPPQVFISHRHGDKAIADMLRNWMDQSTAGRLNIFQSSEFASGPKVGKSLSKELLDNLWHTDVLLLVYT